MFICNACIGQSNEQGLKLDYQGVAYKNYSDSTGKYLIKYNYAAEMAMVPATYPSGESHFFSKIQVYKITECRCFVPKFDTLLIGKEMFGKYVRNGCFEDVPSEWIKIAKSTK